MDDDQRKDLKKRMEEELQLLRARIEQDEKGTGPVEPDAAIGRLSRLDTMLNQEVAKASLSQLKRRVLKLEVALRKVDRPDFGECAECGEEIPMKRLLALPESDFCVHCAE